MPREVPEPIQGDTGGEAEIAPAAPGRFARIMQRIWWLHSFFALSFGLGVMLLARHGLAHADKIFTVLFLSWLLMFVALRFIVGPANRTESDGLTRRGVRFVTNYVIKQLYQQMFFFLVPIYASSATWSLSSFNWWPAPLLLVFAVLSTLDLVFDNVIMEHRVLAAAMYGLAMFGVLNTVLPLVVGMSHFLSLLVAAAATAPAVALLSFRVKRVLTGEGLAITLLTTAALVAGAWFGRAFVPPTPLAMAEAAVGHGSQASYECLPGSKHTLRADQLDGLRCGALIAAPGGVGEPLMHIWRHRGAVVARLKPELLEGCDGTGTVFRSFFPSEELPADPTGKWSCTIETADGQLVGMRKFQVVAAPPP
jgi:uncharacterized protein DUF5924/DUF2914 family protein